MLNQVQLIGFTGAEAEVRTTQGGKQVAMLRVCTSRTTRKDGERKDYPVWHQIEIWAPATVKWLADKALGGHSLAASVLPGVARDGRLRVAAVLDGDRLAQRARRTFPAAAYVVSP